MNNGHTDAKGQPLDFSGEDLRNRHFGPEEPSDFHVSNSTVRTEEPLTDLNTATFDDDNQFISHAQSGIDFRESSPFAKTPPSVNEDQIRGQIGKQTLKGTIQDYQSGLKSSQFHPNSYPNHPVSVLPTPEDLKPGQNPADLLPDELGSIESESNVDPDFPTTNLKIPNQTDQILDSFSERLASQAAPESPEISLSEIMVRGDHKTPETSTVVDNNIHALDKGKIGPADFYYNIRTLLEPLLWNSYGRKFGSFEEQLIQKQPPRDQSTPPQKSTLTHATPKRFFNRLSNRRKDSRHA